MDQAIRLAHVLFHATEQVADAIPRLRGFRDLSHHTVEINRLENEGDRITREAMASLFQTGSIRWWSSAGRTCSSVSRRRSTRRRRREHPRGDRHQELVGASRPLRRSAEEPRGHRTRRMTLAGAPAAIENGGMSLLTTELAPMTQRSPIVTPLVTTTWAPHHTLSPIRVGPLLVKPCQGTGGRGRRTDGWIGDETSVGEHAVVADLDELESCHHDSKVEECARRRCAPAPAAGIGHPDAGLKERPVADLQPAVAQRLEHVAMERPAGEGARGA